MKPDTLEKRVLEFPDQFLQVQGGQLYCVACSTNVGSSKSDVTQYSKTEQHTRKVQQKIAGSLRGVQLLQCITEYKGVVRSQTGGQEHVGFAEVPETIQMTIRRSLTPTKLNYRCSHSLTNETCSSRVSSLR